MFDRYYIYTGVLPSSYNQCTTPNTVHVDPHAVIDNIAAPTEDATERPALIVARRPVIGKLIEFAIVVFGDWLLRSDGGSSVIDLVASAVKLFLESVAGS